MIKQLFSKKEKKNTDSQSVKNSHVNKAQNDPDFPFLVSFPRTGSHWLRMLMELYFEKPSLTRSFYYHDAKDFTCLHHHDTEINLYRKNVIYLYRNPVDTIYSQLNYYKEDINDTIRIKYWALMYGLHLEKYLLRDNFSTNKVILTYEGLKNSMPEEFQKLCKHLNYEFSEEKLKEANAQVNKEKLKSKTHHDEQVVNLSIAYENQRKDFQSDYSDFIWDVIVSVNKDLKDLF